MCLLPVPKSKVMIQLPIAHYIFRTLDGIIYDPGLFITMTCFEVGHNHEEYLIKITILVR